MVQSKKSVLSIILYVCNRIFDFLDHNKSFIVALQPPTLANITIVNNKVRLDINRPNGSFDYVEVHCSDDQTHIIFNKSIPSSALIASVDCSFVLNLPLMNFILTTMKKDFEPSPNSILHEGKSIKEFQKYLYAFF